MKESYKSNHSKISYLKNCLQVIFLITQSMLQKGTGRVENSCLSSRTDLAQSTSTPCLNDTRDIRIITTNSPRLGQFIEYVIIYDNYRANSQMS